MIAKELSLTYDSAHKVEVGEVVGVDGRVRVDLQRIDVVATEEKSRINMCDINMHLFFGPLSQCMARDIRAPPGYC